MSETTDKKAGMFAKLAANNAKAAQHEPEPAPDAPLNDPAPSPAPSVSARTKSAPARRRPEPVKGKRDNPDYCQANAYIAKTVRKSVDRELLDIDGLDYSTLVEDLLRKWLKSRGRGE